MSLLLTILSLFFGSYLTANADEVFGAEQNFYSIQRVDTINSKALVKTERPEDIQAGQTFKLDTPLGVCQVTATEVYKAYFYVDTRQCAKNDVQVGGMIYTESQRQPAEANQSNWNQEESSFFGDSPSRQKINFINNWVGDEFYDKYIAERVSSYITYHFADTLSGSVRFNTGNTLDELSGANTIGFGAEYAIVSFPNRMSISAGLTYELPRAFGDSVVRDANGQGVDNFFGKNPTLFLWNMYANLRYDITDEVMAYLGINRLAANLKYVPGEVNGDFGFHMGARYYAYNQFYVEGSFNFYNLDYQVDGTTFDLSLNEFEVKGGYTF